jgi:NAD-dependent dihydropyrimidine dehydrogenase PreA subunit
MIILEDKCTGCNLCIPYCPTSAIVENPAKGIVTIIEDECAECGVCYRSEICPVKAIYPQDLQWPRTLRAEFSDPSAPYSSPVFRKRRGYVEEVIDRRELLNRKGTAIRLTGRGTAEMKNNDVTGRYKRGYCGIGIEVGRGCGGTRFREVEKITTALAKMGVRFEQDNPTYFLLAEPETGIFLPDILNEKVLSCIVEFSIPIEMLPKALQCLQQVSKEMKSAFAICLISVLEKDGSEPVKKIASEMGIPVSINGKVNVGLGRPLADIG